MRKLIWIGIVLGLIPLYLGSACGGYVGWPGLTTSGADAKLTEEVSVGDPGQLDNGLFTFYVNYNNVGGQNMKTISNYRDGTAPFGVFTSDGNLEQHFNDHVGVLISTAFDKNGDGVICWIGCPFESGDYTIPNAFCPAVGGTATSSTSNGFSAHCDKGVWQILFANAFFEETKQTTPGSKYSNSLGDGSNFAPTVVGQILATSQPMNNKTGGIIVTLNGLSLPSGASHTLSSPATVNGFGYGHGIAVDATQPGLKEAASWLASQWLGQPDGGTKVTLSLNNGQASGTVTVASGNAAALALQSYAGR